MLKDILWDVTKRLIILLIIISSLLLLSASWINQQIFTPSRRALTAFQADRIKNDKYYGLHIRQHQCLQGQVPCLLVEPTTNKPGRRGSILRQQLSAKGVRLANYGAMQGTIVLLHGRRGRKEDMLVVAERFVAAGFRCVLLDLPAHGDSPLVDNNFGSSLFEQQLPQRALQDLRQHFQLPEEPAILWGLSMGGAFAISAMKNTPDYWSAIIIASSFTSLPEVLENITSQYFPTQAHALSQWLLPFLDIARLLKGQPKITSIQPQKWVQHIKANAMVIHGTHDRYIPMQQGKELFASLNSSHKRWVPVPAGGHNNVLATPMKLYAEMSQWMLQAGH